MLKLGVNVDHVATLREARGTSYPRPLEAARLCLDAGAHSITIHLREDRRHIQDSDVREMRRELPCPLNLEMACAESVLRVALEVKPADACLVPERRKELTTEGGLDVVGNFQQIADVAGALRNVGTQVSLFVEPAISQLEAAAKLGVPYVELHTGAFCSAAGARAEEELRRLIEGARVAHRLGLKVNAGHGIHLENIGRILRIPHLDTLNIGHSIVARAVLVGMREAVREMLAAMQKYRGGEP
jgi:pyridoxine 5-phosphate synthase